MLKKPKPDWRSRPRPWARKPEADQRSVKVEIRLTPAERQRVEDLASREGVGLGELCRRALAAYGQEQVRI